MKYVDHCTRRKKPRWSITDHETDVWGEHEQEKWEWHRFHSRSHRQLEINEMSISTHFSHDLWQSRAIWVTIVWWLNTISHCCWFIREITQMNQSFWWLFNMHRRIINGGNFQVFPLEIRTTDRKWSSLIEHNEIGSIPRKN